MWPLDPLGYFSTCCVPSVTFLGNFEHERFHEELDWNYEPNTSIDFLVQIRLRIADMEIKARLRNRSGTCTIDMQIKGGKLRTILGEQ